jgi:1,4-dihydroxy-2-naphthoate polyprenyltransferase
MLFAAMVYGAFLLAPITWIFGPLDPWLLLPFLAIPLAAPIVRTVKTRTDGPSLNEALARTGQLELAYCVLLCAGILLS